MVTQGILEIRLTWLTSVPPQRLKGFIPQEGFTFKREHQHWEQSTRRSTLRDEAREGGDSVTPDQISKSYGGTDLSGGTLTLSDTYGTIDVRTFGNLRTRITLDPCWNEVLGSYDIRRRIAALGVTP
jgi:hypothetical protein